MNGSSHRWPLIIPLLGLLAFVPAFYFTDLDLLIQSRFYDHDTGLWPNAYRQPWIFLNLHGELPSIFLGITSASLLLLSIGRTQLHKFRKAATFVLCTLLIGPGLLVNAVFKDHWGRPRPIEVDLWDGPSRFEPFLHIDLTTVGASFPSGHASMGFFTMVIALLLLSIGRRRPAILLILASLACGAIVGASRVVSGKHFPSDILFAGLLVWATSVALYFALRMHRSPTFASRPNRPLSTAGKILRSITPVLVFLMFCFPLFRWNYQSVTQTTPGFPPAHSSSPQGRCRDVRPVLPGRAAHRSSNSR